MQQIVMGMKVGRLHTLVVLVEAARVDYDLHCARESSLAYRLTNNGLERRKDWQTDLADIYRQRPHDDNFVVLFLGAGFSFSSGLPLGNGLRDSALRYLFPAVASRSNAELIDVFQDYVRSSNRWATASEQHRSRDEFARTLTLERVLREELFRSGFAASPTLREMQVLNTEATTNPGRAVRALRRLMVRERNLVIVTVNFDQLVETAGPARVFASDADFARCPAYLRQYRQQGGAIPVLKVHGTIDRPDTIVATVDATAQGLSPQKTAALQAVVRHGRSVPWIYVGCSMRDPDLENLLAQPAFYTHLDESWVSPFPVATARQFVDCDHDVRRGGEIKVRH